MLIENYEMVINGNIIQLIRTKLISVDLMILTLKLGTQPQLIRLRKPRTGQTQRPTYIEDTDNICMHI